MKDDIINAGGIYTDLPAVVDGKIVTTAHYKDMGPWMAATLDFFKWTEKKMPIMIIELYLNPGVMNT